MEFQGQVNRTMVAWGVGGAVGGAACMAVHRAFDTGLPFVWLGGVWLLVGLVLARRGFQAAACRVVIDDEGARRDGERIDWSAVRRVTERVDRPVPRFVLTTLALRGEGRVVRLSSEAFSPEQFAHIRQLIADRCTIEKATR